MAVDHALLEQVQKDKMPVLRLYTWQPACLSFGRNQPVRDLYSAERVRALGLDVVRRPTGGLAVLHADELTYSVTLPAALLGGARETYCTINRALISALRTFGIDAELSTATKRGAFGTVHPCFAEPAAGEVIVGRAKLVGSAQRCERRTILQHGSILISGCQEDVARAATVSFDLVGRATSVTEVLGHAPAKSALAAKIKEAFEGVCGIPLAPSSHSTSLLDRAADLEEMYRSAAWTWRR